MIRIYDGITEAFIAAQLAANEHRQLSIKRIRGKWYVNIGNKEIKKWEYHG